MSTQNDSSCSYSVFFTTKKKIQKVENFRGEKGKIFETKILGTTPYLPTCAQLFFFGYDDVEKKTQIVL